MKTPRITDFDPDAKLPTLKSSLDQMPAIEKPIVVQHSPPPAVHHSQSAPKDKKKRGGQAAKRIPNFPQDAKRGYVRRTFDFFEDQISYLTQESLKEKLTGKEGSMNAMVREAIDDWIKKRTSGK